MASSLRVNAIIPSSGTNVAIGTAGGTITYNANVSGVSTFSNGISVGTGASISSPATNVLTLGTNNVESVRITSGGLVGVGTNNPASKLTVGGETAQYPSSVQIYSTLHATSRRAAIGLGGTPGNTSPDWLILEDSFGDGVKNFAIYSGAISDAPINIDTSGRVKKPYQPGFLAAKNNSEQTVAGTIVFNTVSTNGGHNIGNHYSTSTGAFTAPIAGRYIFLSSVHSTNGSYKVDTRLRVNGQDTPGGYAINNVDSYTQGTGCSILNLSVNDAVTIYHVSGGVWPDAGLTYFSGYFLG